MLQKSIQNNRGKEHGKRINKTTKNNRSPKKNNANENKAFQRKKVVFYAETFVHFKDDAACHKHNTFIAANGGNETHKVHVKVIKPADKPTPKLPTA